MKRLWSALVIALVIRMLIFASTQLLGRDSATCFCNRHISASRRSCKRAFGGSRVARGWAFSDQLALVIAACAVDGLPCA